MDNLF